MRILSVAMNNTEHPFHFFLYTIAAVRY